MVRYGCPPTAIFHTNASAPDACFRPIWSLNEARPLNAPETLRYPSEWKAAPVGQAPEPGVAPPAMRVSQ